MEPTSSRTDHFHQPVTPDWAWTLSREPDQLADLVRSGRSNIWVERFVRGLDQRLGGALDLPEATRSSAATASWFPPDLVPIVGALSEDRGAMGVLRFDRSPVTLGTPEDHAHSTGSVGSDPVAAACAGVDLICGMMSEFLPNAPRPIAELLVGRSAAGDSVALAAGMGALLRLFGVPWPEDLVVSGGIDPVAGRFTSIPSETRPGKASALRAWGFKRIGLVSPGAGEPPLPEDIDGIQVVPLPSNPHELPAVLASLDGVSLDDADLARALALFDLRVGRAGPHMLDRVLEVSAPFVEHGSPLVRHLAHDMQSRSLLHAGRSEESRRALERADALRGHGYLPDGRLRDVLRYQQPAHRSIVHLDLGEWSDDHPAHRHVDDLIDELDDRWSTKHERLMRIFLANTRARRHEYLGRLGRDEDRFERGWEDLAFDHDAWDELIVGFAGRELRLHDTTRSRIENQMIDIAASRFVALGELPEAWRSMLHSFPERPSTNLAAPEESAVFEFHGPAGACLSVGGDGFDALARLRKHLALGASGVPAELLPLLQADSCVARCAPGRSVHYPWFVWFEQLALLARREGLELPLPAVDERTGAPCGWSHLVAPGEGIMAILALRSRVVLVELGVAVPDGAPPPALQSLRRLHDVLLEHPEVLRIRAPY